MQQTIKEQQGHHQLMMTMILEEETHASLRTTWLSKSTSIYGSNGLTRPSAGLPAAVQPMQTMDLNRIAYRFMADVDF